MPPNGIEFGLSVADVLVHSERDPALFPNNCDPILVRRIRRKVIVVYLNLHP